MAEVSRAASEPQIAALVARSLTSFKELTSTLQDDHARASQASSCLARFKLWAGNLGAHRPSGSRSLEYRLRDASNIRKLVISLLQDLCTLVANGGSISDTVNDGHDAVEDDLADYFNDDGASDKSEVEQTLDEIAHVVDCLLRLSVTIRNPAPHDQFLSRAGEGLVKEFVYWDAKHVRDKFPNVDKDLADRLGRAMARRRQYFKYREEHKSRLAEGLEEDEAEFEGRATTIASSLPEHLKEAGKRTEAGANQLAILDDARSDASATSYATSSPDSTQLRVPPIPKEHIDGKHVFRDLRPYVCLSEACQTPDHLYVRRNDWKMHMRREHWKTWHCPFGCNAEFDSAKGFQNHVKTTHEQNVPPEKIHTLEGLSSRADVTKPIGQCPLCYDFQVGSEKQYEKHVGQHLEHLALFTLPDTGEGGDEDDDGEEDKDEEGLDDEDEDDADEDEEEEEGEWFVMDDSGLKAAGEQEKAEGVAIWKSVEEAYGKAKAAAEAEKAAKKAAQELKEKIQDETKAKLEESQKTELAPIRFKDAVGRKFSFPFRLCATWKGMEELIKQAFLQVDVLGSRVIDGHYDLIGPNGHIILPSFWERVVQPDMEITMRMWPLDTEPLRFPPLTPGEEDRERIRLVEELAALKAMEEKQKAAKEQKETEAQIRAEAEEKFRRRMEEMRISQEKAKEEIEKARIDAETAARQRMEAERKAEEERVRKHEEAMAAAEEEARVRFEAELKTAETRGQDEAEARARAEEESRLMLEIDQRVAEVKMQEEAQERARAEKEARANLEAEAQIRAERKKEEEDREIAELGKQFEEMARRSKEREWLGKRTSRRELDSETSP
ncbi:hypothetical protein Neosp_013190 [[Neocosmospora] mangrovei]